MTSRILAFALAIAALGAGSGPAVAAPGAPSPRSSCAATITAFETQIAPGFVGAEARRLTHDPDFELSAHVTTLARDHRGSFERCLSLVMQDEDQ